MPLPESRQRKSIRVYSRPGCHLCEQLIDELLPLIRGRLDLEVRNVDSRPEWKLKYGISVPVVQHDGEIVCQYHLDTAAIRAILASLPAVGAHSSANE